MIFPIAQFDSKVAVNPARVESPHVATFREFLEHHARVKITAGPEAGRYTHYTFAGREALIEPCEVIDLVLGARGGNAAAAGPLKDSTIVLAGGAQFGKTVLELNLAAYLTAVRFLSPGVYMPDDKLAADIVDAKFRPDVVDQIPWFAEMCKLGKSVNESGKAVDKKGAFLVTDGQRKAVGMFRGLQKVPTSFSLDVVVRDEEDDIPRDKAKFLSGRLTASQLRLQIIVGTQRIHGAGQNKQWEDGSQGVMMIGPRRDELHESLTSRKAGDSAGDSHSSSLREFINPEEHWPQICRVQLGAQPATDDPQLTFEGDFRRPGSSEVLANYAPDGIYYLAHPHTGEPLDRQHVVWQHRRPERVAQRRWSFRISQIGCAAIDLAQIVAHWTRAVMDDEEMISFCCDRKAMPKSAAQSLSPKILDRARNLAPFDFGEINREKIRVAGLDTGSRCWLITREIHSAAEKRIVRADKIALGDLIPRMRTLWDALGLSALFIDEAPAIDEARTLALLFNGLDSITTWPRPDWNNKETFLSFPGGLTWDGRNQQWRGLKCAVVRFSKRQLGMGVEHGAVEFEEAGQQKFVPMIACNRFETIDRVVKEFLTPAENVMEVVEANGKRMVRQDPAMRLPARKPGAPGVLETLDAHLLTGSQRAKEEKTGELGDYVDKCENHYLLADAYSGLAETVASSRKVVPFAFKSIAAQRPNIWTSERGVLL